MMMYHTVHEWWMSLSDRLLSVIQYSFILPGWHIYIEGVGLLMILCSPSIIISIGYLQESEG